MESVSTRLIARFEDRRWAFFVAVFAGMTMLYHLVSQFTFEGQPADEPYAPASLFQEGFIHLSATPQQVAWVASRFYADVPDLVTLVIDETQLHAPVQWDETPDGRFPHLYGPLNREAIVDIVPVARSS